MIIELAVGAGVLVAGVLAARARRAKRETPPAEPPVPAPPRGLRVGDVIMHGGSEVWLAGQVRIDEQGLALAVFTSPAPPWLVQLDSEALELALVRPTGEIPEGDIPVELPVSGVRLSVRRRGQGTVQASGESLPRTTERCAYVVLGGPGGRLAVVVDFHGGDRLALAGELLDPEMLELLPGGDLTR